jgi:hypothetical protein
LRSVRVTSWSSVGDEQAPVLTLDKTGLDHAALTDAAAALAYRPVGPFYPGIRAPAPPPVVRAVMAVVDPHLREGAGSDGRYEVVQAYFSLVTTPPGRLSLPQRLPHYDGVETERLAIMLYLCSEAFGGTSFYRHRETGFETITRERLDPYLGALKAGFAAGDAPPPSYIDGTSRLYDRIGGVEARPGRLVAYRGNLLHGADIPDAAMLSPDPRAGRLTLNIFARTGA